MLNKNILKKYSLLKSITSFRDENLEKYKSCINNNTSIYEKCKFLKYLTVLRYIDICIVFYTEMFLFLEKPTIFFLSSRRQIFFG